jgi:Zn-dependent protease with chaperone function
MSRPLLLIASVALLAISASAMEKPHQGPPQSGAIAGDQGKPAAPEEEAPVPVPPPSDKALAYYRSGNVLWIVDLVWGLLIPALFLFTGFSARIRNWAQKLGRKWFFVVGIYFVIFLILNSIIDLPLSYYEGFVREHAYGLSNQTLAKWTSDELKSLAVGIGGGFLFLWVPYLLLKKSPRRWWLYTALLTVPFMMFVMLIAPIWIDPLFNQFGPMKDKALESKILALAERAGIEGSRVYEVNKSVDTTAVDAYVTGFLQTKRIVLWDTILAKLNEKELLVVVGHEMGHYVLHHIITGIIFSFFLILISLYLAYKLANRLIARYKHHFGFDQLSDIASLPLLLLLVAIFSFLISPISLAFSRYQEHEADRFALEITRNNHDAATAFIKLQQENLAVPRPGLLYKLWRSDHPPVGERIDFCNEYHPWKSGQPLKYADHFKGNP